MVIMAALRQRGAQEEVKQCMIRLRNHSMCNTLRKKVHIHPQRDTICMRVYVCLCTCFLRSTCFCHVCM